MKRTVLSDTEAQSLADRAFVVFVEAWYVDEILYRVITERTHSVENILWKHDFLKQYHEKCPVSAKKHVKTWDFPGSAFDPASDDKFAPWGRKWKQIHTEAIAICRSRLVDSRHPIVPATLAKEIDPDHGNKLFREKKTWCPEICNNMPVKPKVDSMFLLDHLLEFMSRCWLEPCFLLSE